jgi:hypothetical protein
MPKITNPWRRIIIVYRKPTGSLDKCVQFIGGTGVYTHCELYCPDMVHNGTPGWVFTNFSCHVMELTQESIWEYRNDPELFDSHEILIREDQHKELLRWNMDLVSRQCPYNYSDLLLHLLPRYMARALAPDDKDMLETPTKLYCAQAVILALRQSLGPQHRINQLLDDINIHICKPTCIADKLSLLFGNPVGMHYLPVV